MHNFSKKIWQKNKQYKHHIQEGFFWLNQRHALKQNQLNHIKTQYGQTHSIKSVLIQFSQRGIKIPLKTDESSTQCITKLKHKYGLNSHLLLFKMDASPLENSP